MIYTSIVYVKLQSCRVVTIHGHICAFTFVDSSVFMIPDSAMRNISRYLGHDAIRIAMLVYRINQCLDLQFVYDGNGICRYTSTYNYC